MLEYAQIYDRLLLRLLYKQLCLKQVVLCVRVKILLMRHLFC